MPSPSSSSCGGDTVPTPVPPSPAHCWDPGTRDLVASACLQTRWPTLTPPCPRSKNSPSPTNASVTVTVPVEAQAAMELRG